MDIFFVIIRKKKKKHVNAQDSVQLYSCQISGGQGPAFETVKLPRDSDDQLGLGIIHANHPYGT